MSQHPIPFAQRARLRTPPLRQPHLQHLVRFRFVIPDGDRRYFPLSGRAVNQPHPVAPRQHHVVRELVLRHDGDDLEGLPLLTRQQLKQCRRAWPCRIERRERIGRQIGAIDEIHNNECRRARRQPSIAASIDDIIQAADRR